MKDLAYYDARHGNAIIIKSPKSRKEAEKKIMTKYVPKWFDSSTIEEMDFEAYFLEADNIVTI